MATPTATPTLEPTTTPETTVGPDVWRGLVVAPEDRCSPYDSDDYPYSQSVEQRIVASMGGIIYGPYTGKWFDSTSELTLSTSSRAPRLTTVASAQRVPQ